MTNIHSQMNSLNSLSSHMFLPHIVEPRRIRNNFKTLIDNIYSNAITPNNILGTITATILDYLPQFLIAPGIFSNTPSTKLSIFESDAPDIFSYTPSTKLGIFEKDLSKFD